MGCKIINRNNLVKLGNCNFYLIDGFLLICNIFLVGNNCLVEIGVKDDVGVDFSLFLVKYLVDGFLGVRIKVLFGK